ncbi:MAG: hypothetical protein QM655_09755 [Nocardioidaceae bacterium]
MTKVESRTSAESNIDPRRTLPALPGQPEWFVPPMPAPGAQIPQQYAHESDELPTRIHRAPGHRRGVGRMRALAQRLMR